MTDVEIIEKNLAQLGDKKERAEIRIKEIDAEISALGFRIHVDNDDDEQRTKKQMLKDPLKRLKSFNAVAICKQMVAEERAFGLSEHDLVSLLDNYAKAHQTTFSALFTKQDDVGLALRKAVDICKREQWLSRTKTEKAATLTPRVTGGRGAQAVDNPRDVMDDIQRLVAQQRAQNPTLREAQAFSRVYEDPNNKDLVARERAANRPTAGW
jgi:hypothetical protein